MNDNLPNKIMIAVKAKLSEYLGVEPDDIAEDDTFLHDLHMRPPEFSDFLEELSDNGLDTSRLELSSIKTVGDLVEALSSHEYLG